MSTEKVHDGTWKECDEIDPLKQEDQVYPNNLQAISKNPKLYTILGLDTEMLISINGRQVWPWELGWEQERDSKNLNMSDLSGSFDWHGDGYAAELCTMAAHCLEYKMGYISSALQWLSRKQQGMNVEISSPPSYSIPKDVEDAAPENAKQLGCMPSQNAYDDAGDPKSLPDNKRTTGCHLHISHPVLASEETAINTVKWADVLVGCTWTYISPNPSKVEAERRKAYGRAGEYRLKIYPVYPESQQSSKHSRGVEYRVLPGTPIQHPAYLTLMFNLYRSAMRLAANYGAPHPDLSAAAKTVINEADKVEAKKIIRSLPLSTGGRKLIRFLRRTPIKASVSNWITAGYKKEGHAALFDSQKLALRPLTL